MNPTEDEYKKLFALHWLETDDCFEAMRRCGRTFEFNLQNKWINDPVVLKEKQRLLDDAGTELAFLPTKAKAARRAWELANDTAIEPKDQLAALRLFNETLGYIEKPGMNINNNVSVSGNKVMVIKDHGGTDDWERGLRENQEKLANETK